MCLLSPKHLDAISETSELPLLEKSFDASAKIPDSTLHKSSSYRAQEERAALDPFDWNAPNSTRADAIHRDESKHLLDFYLISNGPLSSFHPQKNQRAVLTLDQTIWK